MKGYLVSAVLVVVACSSAGGEVVDSDECIGRCLDDGGRPDAGRNAGPIDGGREAAADACVQSLVYVDADGDGYGASGAVPVCVPASSGYAAIAGDCDDTDARAFPGQPLFMQGTTKSAHNGDFNCDGTTETLVPTTTKTCGGSACGATSAWLNTAPPCGQEGTWLISCSSGGPFACSATTEKRFQACR